MRARALGSSAAGLLKSRATQRRSIISQQIFPPWDGAENSSMSGTKHGGSLERTALPVGHSLLLSGGSRSGGITSRMPQSSVLGRLQSFLPEMKRANAELASSATGTSDPVIAEQETQDGDDSVDQQAVEAASTGASAPAAAAVRAQSEGGGQEQAAETGGSVEMNIALGLWDTEATEAAAVEAIEERSGDGQADVSAAAIGHGAGRTAASSAPAPPVIQELHADSGDSQAASGTKHKRRG